MDPQMAEAFRWIPYGIYVLATRRGAESRAMIVSWVSQVSYSPPLLMVALRQNRPALPAIQESGAFSLSLLSRDQKPLVEDFKQPTSPIQPSDLFRPAQPERTPHHKGGLRFMGMPPFLPKGSWGSCPDHWGSAIDHSEPGGGTLDDH